MEKMKNNHKSRLAQFWELVKADAKTDNVTKARIAEETVQDAVTGLQKTLNLFGSPEKNSSTEKDSNK